MNDINVSLDSQNRIAEWKNLKAYTGFKLLVRELQNIIDESEKTIFALGADHKKLYTDRDVAIIKRDNAMRIKDLPDIMIKTLSGTGTAPTENPDAFEEMTDISEDMEDDI